MLFAGDIILVDEIKVKVCYMLESWRSTLEFICFRLIKIKIEYMECKFSTIWNRDENRWKFKNYEVPKSDQNQLFIKNQILRMMLSIELEQVG